MPRQKNHALLASLAGIQAMNPSVFAGQKITVAPLAGEAAMPCSAFARAWRFENEANRAYRFVWLWGDVAA